jgi:hypothetical protein
LPISVQLDSLDAEPPLTVDAAPTGDSGRSQTVELPWAPPTGEHTVYFRFHTPSDDGVATFTLQRSPKVDRFCSREMVQAGTGRVVTMSRAPQEHGARRSMAPAGAWRPREPACAPLAESG